MTDFKPAVVLSSAMLLYALPSFAFGSVSDAIYSAAKRGDFRSIESYLSQGYAIDSTDSSGNTALCKAASDGQKSAYNLLLQYGANPSASCMYTVKSSMFSSTKYWLGGAAIIGGGVAIAAAAGGGGGGGGNSGSSAASLPSSSSGGGTSGSGSATGGNTGTGDNQNGDELSDAELAGLNANESDEKISGGYPGSGYTIGGSWSTGGSTEVISSSSSGGSGSSSSSGGSWSTGGSTEVISSSSSGGSGSSSSSGGSWSTGGSTEVISSSSSGGSGSSSSSGGSWSTGGGTEVISSSSSGGSSSSSSSGGSWSTGGGTEVISSSSSGGSSSSSSSGGNISSSSSGGSSSSSSSGGNSSSSSSGGNSSSSSSGENSSSSSSGGSSSSSSSGGNSSSSSSGGNSSSSSSGGSSSSSSSGGSSSSSSSGGNSSSSSSGGSSSSSSSGGNSSSSSSGGNTPEIVDPLQPVASGNVKRLYTENEFKSSAEYNGSNFGSGSMNYLGSINAAKAYSYFVGVDDNGKLATNLDKVSVGIVDTGVWQNHSEFALTGGANKISGHNYDYGPCRGSDYKNCWRIVKTLTRKMLVFSKSWINVTIYNNNMSDAEVKEFEDWASAYDANYDWDSRQVDVTPNKYTDNDEVMHGTHVAGLIAANMDNSGMMGVAFANAEIQAVRWDFQSSLADPINYLLNSGVKFINLSMGITSTNNNYNAHTLQSSSELNKGFVESMKAIIARNSTENGYTDGVVVVKAAGNEGADHPDKQSGIKLLKESFTYGGSVHSFDELQMLVVTAVDVQLDANGDVQNYKLSSYANKCGDARSYCIAAPGGNYSASPAGYIYSTAQPDYKEGNNTGYYGTMGTSQATPIVTGALAFLKGAYPYMSSQELIELVYQTANKSAADYTDSTYGAGLLDLGSAVTTYIRRNSEMKVATFAGNNIKSELVGLDGASLNVSSTFGNAMEKALPASITIFDRYNRPFQMATSNYVHVTHGSYKSLKNDVMNIAQSPVIKTYRQGKMSFSFAPSALNKNSDNMIGFMDVNYKNQQGQSGFYFSENTAYKSSSSQSRELKNPYMHFNNAYGVYHQYDFGTYTGIKIEAVTGQNGLYDGDRDYRDATFNRQAYAINAEWNLHKSNKYMLALSSGFLYEDKALLGVNGDGAFAVDNGNTYTAGITMAFMPYKKLTFSGSYYHGWTASGSFASNLLRTSKLESSSFAFEADYAEDNQTHYGIRLSSPLKIEKGKLYVDFPSGRDNFSDIVYHQTYAANLKSNRREYRLTAYYNKELSENLNFRTETGVRFNPEHQNEANDYLALIGMTWNFN